MCVCVVNKIKDKIVYDLSSKTNLFKTKAHKKIMQKKQKQIKLLNKQTNRGTTTTQHKKRVHTFVMLAKT